MGKIGLVLLSIVGLGATPPAEGPPAVPGDFKILIADYGLAARPVYTEEMVAISGRVYLFASNSREVVIIEPARSSVDLLDIERKVQSELTFVQIDAGLARVRSTLDAEILRREKTGKRADAVEAQMTRDLAEPRFAVAAGPGPGRVRLTNSTIEVVAVGEPDTEPARLALVGQALATIARLGAFRTPKDLPPFAELDAIAALTEERKLRPTELAYLYRLAGPPRRFRRTYRLVEGPTDRDREAIRRIDHLRESAPSVRYEKYRGDR